MYRSQQKKSHRSLCKISGKMKLATTFLWWLFDMQKAKKIPREAGRTLLKLFQFVFDINKPIFISVFITHVTISLSRFIVATLILYGISIHKTITCYLNFGWGVQPIIEKTNFRFSNACVSGKHSAWQSTHDRAEARTHYTQRDDTQKPSSGR